MSMVSRRDFLAFGGGALATAGLGGLAGCDGKETDTTPEPEPTVTEATLTIGYTELKLGGRRVKMRTYGGGIPGPTIRTKPGALLKITVRNDLPEYDSSAWESLDVPHEVLHNIPHDLNTTNLHVHGLAVIPHIFEPPGTDKLDAPMIAIGPGEERTYEFELPEDHPTGLFWYHPHHHGSTTVQVQNGMAGLIVVEGAIDEVPEIKAAKEILLAVQDVGLFATAEDPDLYMYNPPQNAIYDTYGNSSAIRDAEGKDTGMPTDSGFSVGGFPLHLFLVNGQAVVQEEYNAESPPDPIVTQLEVPRFTIRPGEVVRFRMLNGCADQLILLQVEEHTLHLIGMDGVNFPALRERPYVADAVDGQEQVVMAPGNRAEFLIKGSDKPGIYKIAQIATTQTFIHGAAKVLAEIEVAGDPMDMALPEALPEQKRHLPLTTADEVKAKRTITFGMLFPPQKNLLGGVDFFVNDALYDETKVPIEVEVGTVEEWTINDNHHVEGGTHEGHPFHLHDNSFEVISIGGKAVEPGTIQDTIWVPPMTPVVIRIRFIHWTGKTIFHCHVLPHEDLGMMQNILMK